MVLYGSEPHLRDLPEPHLPDLPEPRLRGLLYGQASGHMLYEMYLQEMKRLKVASRHGGSTPITQILNLFWVSNPLTMREMY